MLIYIAGIIGFISFIYYSYFRSVKIAYKDIFAMLIIVLFPIVINFINVYNITLYIAIFTIISITIIYIYTKKLKVKTSVILIGFTILKYALYSNLIASIIYKCLFDSVLKYNYSFKILSSGYLFMDIIICSISMISFLIMHYRFMKRRIENKYIYLNKQYKYSIYVTLSYCIDNIVIAYFTKWIFIGPNSIETIKYIIIYTIISELIIQNILIKAELSYIKYNFELINKQLENQIKHYNNYEKYVRKIRYIIHDIKNHKFVINKLLINKSYEDAKKFLNDLDLEIEENDYKFITENIFLDAIVKNKIKACKMYGIKFNYDIFIPKDINIRSIHLSVIFNNLLDNAIEACINIDELEIDRYINLECDVINNKLICVIKNSKNKNKLKLDKNLNIRTVKKDKDNHGIGIENLKLTIEKYNGVINFKVDENCFTVKFIIPLQ